nr:hypothetical protein [Tanacetum cinerariifolium]
MGRDTVQLETAVITISQEYLLEFTSQYGISEALYPEQPRPEDRIVDFPEGKAGPRSGYLQLRNFLVRGYQTNYYHLIADMDLFNLIRAPNPTKVKTGSLPRTAHEVPLLTVTANRVIEMEDPTAATNSSGVPSTIERSPLDFTNETRPEDQETTAPEVPPLEDMSTMGGAPEAGPAERVAATDPLGHADHRPTESARGGKSLAAIEVGMGSTRPTHAPQSAPADVSDLDPLSFADPRSRLSVDVAQSSKGAAAIGDPESDNTSFASMVRSPESIYRPEWGITNGSMLDTPEACQDLVDHVALPGYNSKLCHLHNDDFLRQYNVAHRDKRIQARENEIKNMETLLEAEGDMKKAAEDKSAMPSQELENMRALFLDLQVSNNRLSQQVSTLQEQVSGEEKLKAAFEEFKQYEDNRVEQRCAEMDARLDALSIAFSDVVLAGIAKGMSEGLKHEVEHGQAQLDLEAIEAYDLKVEAKYIAALQALKNMKYPLVDQLVGLKDAPMDVIMASLHLESDTEDDAPQWVRELRPSSSQLTIPVYLEVRDPMDPWACKEEMLLADAIAANVSHKEKKKKCRVVCHTHGVGSAHHAQSDGVSVFVPTVVPQGLAILLLDAATQTDTSDGASQLLRSSSLPVMHS